MNLAQTFRSRLLFHRWLRVQQLVCGDDVRHERLILRVGGNQSLNNAEELRRHLHESDDGGQRQSEARVIHDADDQNERGAGGDKDLCAAIA